MDYEKLAQNICKILKDNKAEDVAYICVKGKTDVADYFVLSSGRSKIHTRSLIDKVEEEVFKLGFSPARTEGAREGRWAVMDYGEVIVHIFNDETRVLYHLEELWGDGNNTVKF